MRISITARRRMRLGCRAGAVVCATIVFALRSAYADDHESAQAPLARYDAASEKIGDLLFLGWAEPRDGNQVAGRQHVSLSEPRKFWNLHGELVSPEETRRARLAASSGVSFAWNAAGPGATLRPLVVVCRADPTVEGWSASITAIDADGKRHSGGTTGTPMTLSANISPSEWLVRRSSKLPESISLFRVTSRLAVSELHLSASSLPKWPEKMSFEVKYPLENPQLSKTIREIPEEPIPIAEGVEWSFESDVERLQEVGIGSDDPCVLVRYEKGKGDWETYPYRVWTYLRGQRKFVEWESRIGTPERQVDRVSSVKARRDVEKIEVWRQRFAYVRTDNVPLRLDLLSE